MFDGADLVIWVQYHFHKKGILEYLLKLKFTQSFKACIFEQNICDFLFEHKFQIVSTNRLHTRTQTIYILVL